MFSTLMAFTRTVKHKRAFKRLHDRFIVLVCGGRNTKNEANREIQTYCEIQEQENRTYTR